MDAPLIEGEPDMTHVLVSTKIFCPIHIVSDRERRVSPLALVAKTGDTVSARGAKGSDARSPKYSGMRPCGSPIRNNWPSGIVPHSDFVLIHETI